MTGLPQLRENNNYPELLDRIERLEQDLITALEKISDLENKDLEQEVIPSWMEYTPNPYLKALTGITNSPYCSSAWNDRLETIQSNITTSTTTMPNQGRSYYTH